METKEDLAKRLSAYLLENLNRMALCKSMVPISCVINGQTATLSTAPSMPCMLFAISSRELVDAYFTRFNVSLGISFTCVDPSEGEKTGDDWEDILEVLLRTDCSLGDNVLSTQHEISIEGIALSGMYVVYCEFDVEVER